MLYSLVLGVHVVLCVLVVLVVLVQSGKGAGLSNVFGGGGSDAVFSAPSGSTFIRKVTAGVAGAFFLSSLLLTFLGSKRGYRTVTENITMPPVSAPVAPTAPTVPTTTPDSPKK